MALGRRRFASLALPLLAAACSSPDPVYYTVATRPGPVLPSGPKVVMLKDIGLASYLDRREIVRSSEGYKLDVRLERLVGRAAGRHAGQQRWSSSFPSACPAARSMRRAAPSTRIPTPSSASISSVSMPTAPARSILLAQVAVEFNRPQRTASRTFTITKPLPAPGTPGLVAAISDAVAELADGIAALLQP